MATLKFPQQHLYEDPGLTFKYPCTLCNTQDLEQQKMDLKVLHYQRVRRSVGKETRLCVQVMLMHHVNECVFSLLLHRGASALPMVQLA